MKLSQKEKELVAIGAAIGSNCVPCIEFHIPVARKSGLTDENIQEAINLAEKVKQVPAKKVLERAEELITGSQNERKTSCCGEGERNITRRNNCC